MKRIAIWNIIIGVMCVFFTFIEFRRPYLSYSVIIFFAFNAVILLTYGFKTFKSDPYKTRFLGIITCVIGMLASIILYPYIFRLFVYREGMKSLRIIWLFYVFLAYYVIQFIIILRIPRK